MTRSRLLRSTSAALLACCVLTLGSGLARAQELGHGVQLHGFVSQTAVWTSDNQVGGRSADGVGLDMRELGANLSWRPDPDWLLSGQVLARWAGEADRGGARVDYAFVDRSWRVGETTRLGARLGKVKNPYGFFNTTRDVAHTRPGVIMPQSVYLDQIRNFFLAAPGVTLYGDTETSGGSLSWQLGVLRPEVDDVDLEYMFFLAPRPGRFEGANSWLGKLLYEPDGGRWRLGLTLGEMNMRYQPGNDPLGTGRNSLPTWVLSLEHNREHWTWTGEYAQTISKFRDYGAPFNANRDNTVEAWYVQATRRFGPDWRAYLRYDVLYLDRKDRDGAHFSLVTGGLPGHLRYARDAVLGVRYDVGGFAFWAEYHHVDGTAWLARVDNPVGNKLKRDWDMLVLQAAWYF